MKTKWKLQAKKELRLLNKKALQIQVELERVLEEDFERKLFRVTDLDKYKLLKLTVWAEKYGVSVRWILMILLPYYHDRFAKRSKKLQLRKGLGVMIGTLTGKVSELMVREAVGKEYPSQENIAEQIFNRRVEIIAQENDEEDDGVKTRALDITRCKTIQEYNDKYTAKIAKQRELFDNASSDKKRRRLKWRGNPWIQ